MSNYKIYFELDAEDWHAHSSERLWAEQVNGGDVDAYRLLNSPFFSVAASCFDVVSATFDNQLGELRFIRVIESAGHSTYIVLVDEQSNKFKSIWGSLESLGCIYESGSVETSFGNLLMYSIDVPPSANIQAIYSLLEANAKKGALIFQTGNVGHPTGRIEAT